MTSVWPSFAKITRGIPGIEAHHRGGAGVGGHYSHERAPGAAWRWTLAIAPMVTADALKFRAFLHGLRGANGAFEMPMPARDTSTGAVDGGAAVLSRYSEPTTYSDGTTYTDYVVASGTTASAAADAHTITVSGFSAGVIQVGGFLTVVTATGTQLLRVVAVSGNDITFRPRLRAAVSSGAAVAYGRVTGMFRLTGNPPAVPLMPGRSGAFDIELEEVY